MIGAALFWVVPMVIPAEYRIVAAWIGMIGIILMLHFGSFHALSCFWRMLGIDAKPLMNRPLSSLSVSEF
jgi:hypothetical protein